MVTWQRRSSLRSRRIMSVTALGRSSLSFFPLITGPPSLLASSPAVLALSGWGYAELRIYGVLRSSLPSGVRCADGANLVGQPLEERCLTTPATRQVSAAGVVA